VKLAAVNAFSLEQVVSLYASPHKAVGDSANNLLQAALLEAKTALWGPEDGPTPQIYDKNLVKVLLKLGPAQDPRQKELLLAILFRGPSLVLPFLSRFPLSLEPRLSMRWLGAADLAVRLIGLSKLLTLTLALTLTLTLIGGLAKLPALDEASIAVGAPVKRGGKVDDAPTAEELRAAICPSGLTKSSWTRGLINKSILVRQMTLRLLHSILSKIDSNLATGEAGARAVAVSALGSLPDLQGIISARVLPAECIDDDKEGHSNPHHKSTTLTKTLTPSPIQASSWLRR